MQDFLVFGSEWVLDSTGKVLDLSTYIIPAIQKIYTCIEGRSPQILLQPGECVFHKAAAMKAGLYVLEF